MNQYDQYNGQYSSYCERGFCRFAYDAALAAWVDSVSAAAEATLTDARHSHWWRCGGTWFAGVNVLENDGDGKLASEDSLPLQGEAYDFICRHVALSHNDNKRPVLDKAQISVCTAGYPQKSENDSDAAHRFRLKRDAAHLDGLLKDNASRNAHSDAQRKNSASRNVHSDAQRKDKRYMLEYHGFILGIGMNDVSETAAPFTVFEQSHKPVQAWLKSRLQNIAPEKWGNEDLTEEYKSLRKRILEESVRTEVPLQKGEAILVHRFAIHGTATWRTPEAKMRENFAHHYVRSRMLAFFRPPITAEAKEWLTGL